MNYPDLRVGAVHGPRGPPGVLVTSEGWEKINIPWTSRKVCLVLTRWASPILGFKGGKMC